jgi:hypothetical protein
MADLDGFYDPNAEDVSYELLPAGDYRAFIISDEWKPVAKDGSKGDKLVFTWKVEGGDFNDRLVWQELLLRFQNGKTAESTATCLRIANSDMKQVREATGVITPVNGEQLHHRACIVRVEIEKGKDGYPDRNKIKKVMPLAVANAQMQAPAPRASALAVNAYAAQKAPDSAVGSKSTNFAFARR